MSVQPDPERFPALALWQQRVRSGADGQRPDAPASWPHTALWAAACWEQSAWEAERAGDLERCERLRARARHELAARLARGQAA